MKITKEPVPDIYTRKVTVEMTEAEWEFITGLASGANLDATTAVRAAAAARLANGSKFYWEKNLDYSKLFVSEAGTSLNGYEAALCGEAKYLDAIKNYRTRTGCSLKDAKDAVDKYRGL